MSPQATSIVRRACPAGRCSISRLRSPPTPSAARRASTIRRRRVGRRLVPSELEVGDRHRRREPEDGSAVQSTASTATASVSPRIDAPTRTAPAPTSAAPSPGAVEVRDHRVQVMAACDLGEPCRVQRRRDEEHDEQRRGDHHAARRAHRSSAEGEPGSVAAAVATMPVPMTEANQLGVIADTSIRPPGHRGTGVVCVESTSSCHQRRGLCAAAEEPYLWQGTNSAVAGGFVVDIEALRLLTALADTGSLTAAGRRLGVTQQAASARLRRWRATSVRCWSSVLRAARGSRAWASWSRGGVGRVMAAATRFDESVGALRERRRGRCGLPPASRSPSTCCPRGWRRGGSGTRGAGRSAGCREQRCRHRSGAPRRCGSRLHRDPGSADGPAERRDRAGRDLIVVSPSHPWAQRRRLDPAEVAAPRWCCGSAAAARAALWKRRWMPRAPP